MKTRTLIKRIEDANVPFFLSHTIQRRIPTLEVVENYNVIIRSMHKKYINAKFRDIDYYDDMFLSEIDITKEQYNTIIDYFNMVKFINERYAQVFECRYSPFRYNANFNKMLEFIIDDRLLIENIERFKNKSNIKVLDLFELDEAKYADFAINVCLEHPKDAKKQVKSIQKLKKRFAITGRNKTKVREPEKHF